MTAVSDGLSALVAQPAGEGISAPDPLQSAGPESSNSTLKSPAATARAGAAHSDHPRQLQNRSVDDVMSVAGSLCGSLAFVWVVYNHVLPWSGSLGFIVCWWLVFVLAYAGVSALANPLPIVRDRVVGAVVFTGAAVVVGALVSTVAYITWQGIPALRHANFYTKSMEGVAPTDPLNRGGLRSVIVGSGVEVGVATVIALPLGVLTAVYMTEVGGRLARLVRTVVESMTALPDVLAGLFVYTFLILSLHWEQNGFAVGIALTVTMTPTVARSSEVVLRVVPSGLREAGLALGASKWQTVRRVVLPTSKSGLATALILGIARVAGETAPLLILARNTTFFNANPFKGQMNSLPLFIYQAARSPQNVAHQRAYGAATVLLMLVLVLFLLTRFLARDKNGSRK